eukprot:comp20366_c0_seq1/m.25729 comp20366_c0_seq1/g.25729  ORF comp20366_c0_seq1/g.25729 comp20366_c0_seq1/m.25729 type:complete len:105 (-) comp20366_c0_seq1:385-699(-)
MGRKFHCDHCNVSFLDNPSSRRRHRKSTKHAVQMRMHYGSFKVREGHRQGRALCYQFTETGTCQNQPDCSLLHILPGVDGGTPEEIEAAEFIDYIINKYTADQE